MALRNHGRYKKTILTMHGRITFERTMLVGENAESRAKIKELTGESCIFPLDCALGISKVPFKMTPRMILTVAREGVRGKSYKEAAITLNDRFNVEFKPDLVRRVTDHVGRIVWNDDLEQAKQAKEWHGNQFPEITFSRL